MKLNNLQILRGISALLVCCFHMREHLVAGNIKLGEMLFSRGSIGVPIFFIISGFIMVFTTKNINLSSENRIQEIFRFLKKRFLRIIPLYYLLTFGWIILGGSISYYFAGEGLERLISSLLFIPQNNVLPVLYLGWSLNYEILFYLIFAFSFLLNKNRIGFVIIFFLTTFILGEIFKPENAYLKMLTSHLNLYFLVGIGFYFLFKKFSVPKNLATIFSFSGIILFCLMFFNINAVKSEFLLMTIVALFVFAFLCFDYIFKLKGSKYLAFLGDISFSLYLSHTFIEVVFNKFRINDYLSIPFFLIKILVVIGISSVLYFIVEKRFTDFLKVKLKI